MSKQTCCDSLGPKSREVETVWITDSGATRERTKVNVNLYVSESSWTLQIVIRSIVKHYSDR